MHNPLRERLNKGKVCAGILTSMPSVNMSQTLSNSGFDWLFIDMEHGTFDVDLACQISSASLATGVTPIVRIPGHQHFHIARVLDGGAQGVIAPHVDTVEQAEAIIDPFRPGVTERLGLGPEDCFKRNKKIY